MILITGATGSLGALLTRRLAGEGRRVAALCLPGDPGAAIADLGDAVDRRTGDVTDPASVEAAMDGIDAVFHLAAVVPFLNALRPRMEAVNIGGTRAVLAAARRAGVRRLVHVSSASVVALPADGTVAAEDHPDQGDSGFAYVDTKRAAERLVSRAAAQGVDAVVVNPTAILAAGDGSRFSWGRLVADVAAGRVRAAPPGGIGVCAGADAVDGLIAAMDRGRAGRRYILNSANVDYAGLFAAIADVAGRRGAPWVAPAWAVRLVGTANGLRARLAGDPMAGGPLVAENARLLNRRLFYDQTRAVVELGIGQTGLADAIRAVLAAPAAQPAAAADRRAVKTAPGGVQG